MAEGKQPAEDGSRYKIRIDGINYYVFLSDTSLSVSYAYENREENITTRTILEKFCAKLSKIMEERNNVRKALVNDSTVGASNGIESKDGTPKEVCG